MDMAFSAKRVLSLAFAALALSYLGAEACVRVEEARPPCTPDIAKPASCPAGDEYPAYLHPVGDCAVPVQALPEGLLGSSFGGAYLGETSCVVVRDDLSGEIREFVIAHEFNHIIDKCDAGGWVGREARANLVAAFDHPAGFVRAAVSTLTDGDRVMRYMRLLVPFWG